MKKLLILSAVLLLAGCGSMVVPDYRGMSEKEAQDKGIQVEYKYKRHSGKEVVVSQSPSQGKTVPGGTKITVTVADENFQTALDVAEEEIVKAETRMRECASAGIDVSDLDITEANKMLREAKTFKDVTEATSLAENIITTCDERLGGYLQDVGGDDRK